jgi:hypothetical protein
VGESANTSTEISEGDLTQDLEFPLTHFSDIVAATETSFIKVYKVLVPLNIAHFQSPEFSVLTV